ncbi:S41 family peptidase [Tellurirhabdus rosea]|uniref:S41 family peptidase n=1 Tax=Tellurirhabdus rosea TaxID=2674997 RepID=UPI00225B5554|nr:S41 family peptidase [Tellurirhabdus rosea]
MKFLIWALCLLGWLSVGAQPLTPEKARADMKFLKRKLDRLYPGIGHYAPQANYERLYDSLVNQAAPPVSYHDFFQRQVVPLIASLKDGHLAVMHARDYIIRPYRYFPFEVRQVGSRYYISHNLSADTSLRRGTEILALNGEPFAAIHETLQRYHRGGNDGDLTAGARTRSLVYFPVYYLWWYGPQTYVTLTCRTPGDTTVRDATVSCLTSGQLHRYAVRRYRSEMKSTLPNLAVRKIDSLPGTAVLRIETFSNSSRDWFGLRYNRQLRKAFTEIKDQNVQNLVIDVRNNGGGTVLNAVRLLSYWMPQPFQLMEPGVIKRGGRSAYVKAWNPFTWMLFPVFYKKDPSGGFRERPAPPKRKPQQELAYRGNLYFLVNGASYSATTSVLAKTLDAGLGTFVGEPSGGAYWGDFAGQFQYVTLPNSGIRVRIPLKKLIHAVNPKNANGFTVEPDFTVDRTLDDILQGRDYLLHRTLELVKQGKLAEREAKRRQSLSTELSSSR